MLPTGRDRLRRGALPPCRAAQRRQFRRRAVIFAPEARDDLARLYDWIADAAGPAIALSYIERVEAYCLGFDRGYERGATDNAMPPAFLDCARQEAYLHYRQSAG